MARPFGRLILPPAVVAAAVEHLRGALPNEGCGVISGRVSEFVAAATAFHPVGNDLASGTEYATSPRDLLAAFRAMRAAGTDLLAVVHSHPTSAPTPSRKDIARNTYADSAVHLIVGLAGPAPDTRGWWLTDNGFEPADLS